MSHSIECPFGKSQVYSNELYLVRGTAQNQRTFVLLGLLVSRKVTKLRSSGHYLTLRCVILVWLIKGAFLWGDLDQDQWSKICLDHGASKKPVNSRPEWIHRFLWCSMIWMILNQWSWFRSPKGTHILKSSTTTWRKFVWVIKWWPVKLGNNFTRVLSKYKWNYLPISQLCVFDLFIVSRNFAPNVAMAIL